MYRILITLVCIGIVTSAPQDSKITYVKRHIDSEHIDNQKHELNDNSRESKVEIVPLTIAVSGENLTESNDPEQSHRHTIVDELYQQNNNPQTDYNYSDRIYSIKTKPKKNNQSTTTEKYHLPQVTEENHDISTDTEPAESVQTDTVTRTANAVTIENITKQKLVEKDINNEGSTEINIINERSTEVNIIKEQKSPESSETVTKYNDQPPATSITTETYEETTKALTTTKATTPRALPKLSYFEKPNQVSFSRNLIAHSGKRKFRSKCRCEKIWNCTKLQVSVARCPDEYFLCCA